MKSKELKEKLKYYLSLNYPMLLNRDEEEGIFVVQFLDLPGCMAHGKTPANALKLAEEVKKEWIESVLLDGQPVPEPRKEEEYSGKFVVRITPALHKRLSEQAEREGRSLNQHVSIILSERSSALSLENTLASFGELQRKMEQNIAVFEERQKEALYIIRKSAPLQDWSAYSKSNMATRGIITTANDTSVSNSRPL